MRTTVAIPLHRSLEWLEVVERNVRALAPTATVVVSDATQVDDALERLADRLADVTGVTYLGARDLEPGWIAHCNDLQSRCDTEFFMWLPHDDEIDADWIIQAERAFDAAPRAALACGVATRIDPPDASATLWRIVPNAGLAVDSDLDRRARLVEVLTIGDHSQLGLLFRGVQRAAFSVPLPHVAGGYFADVAWAVQMVSRGPIAVLDASYRKRWYEGSAHSDWPAFAHVDGVRSDWVPWAIHGLATDDAIALITHAWENEHRHQLSRLATTEQAWADQVDFARQEADRVKDRFESSRSWRVTAPLRMWSGLRSGSGLRPWSRTRGN